MDSSVSPKDEIWFLCVCHHISNAAYYKIYVLQPLDSRFHYAAELTWSWKASQKHPVHIETEEFSDVRFKQRALIQFLTADKVPPIEIHRRMQAVYGDQCVDVRIVRRWVRRFKDGELGQADLSDKTRSGRHLTASDQLHQDRVEELIRGYFVEN